MAAHSDDEEYSTSQLPCKTSVQVSVSHELNKTARTHACDLTKIALRVDPQCLDRNTETLVFTLPHVGEPAFI